MAKRAPRYPQKQVHSVHELIAAITVDTASWDCRGHVRPWFRGQSDAGEGPLPSVLRTMRASAGEISYDEFHMTTMFRLKAPSFGTVPETSRLDQWLFLMQHYGLPTRLLDWTENPLAACFFAAATAAESGRPADTYRDPKHIAVWVLHPIQLNMLADRKWNDFPNTWKQSPCLENFKIAFGTAGRDRIVVPGGGVVTYEPTKTPLAVLPSNVAPRVAVQRSCFTVHGTDRRDFENIFAGTNGARQYLKKYVLPRKGVDGYMRELEANGVSYSTLFPDFDGLAREMKRRFFLPTQTMHIGRRSAIKLE